MMAAIAGLEALNRPCEIELYSDSQYLVNAFNQHWIEGWIKKGWKRGKNEEVKNVDLWKRLLAAKEPHQISFFWVKGSLYQRMAHELVDPWMEEASPKKSKSVLIRRLRDYDRWLGHGIS